MIRGVWLVRQAEWLNDESMVNEGALTINTLANIVVLTQSCDLEDGAVDDVLVAPYFTEDELLPAVPKIGGKAYKEEIRKGRVQGLYLLPPCSIDANEAGYRFASFRQVATVPLSVLNQYVDLRPARLRLISPYRDHLVKSFTDFVGRIALPRNYPSPGA